MLKKIEKIIGVLAACLLFILMLFTFIDVIGRNVFNRPLVGASELTEVTLAAIIFLLLPSVAFRQEHIVVDLIDVIAGDLLNFVQRVLTALFGGAVFGITGWQLWVLGGKAAGYHDATPSLGIPLAPVLYGMSMLAFVTTVGFLALVLRGKTNTVSAELASARKLAAADEKVHGSSQAPTSSVLEQ
ncbi:MAG: TRAP transporter small permease [Rhizobiaceae bacterium]|nr:TRAP transporter small permease [Rhizobiaceae bacterium]MCV0404933.1 TRAP transporter small permease [Rhizobiaceae bacterium]